MVDRGHSWKNRDVRFSRSHVLHPVAINVDRRRVPRFLQAIDDGFRKVLHHFFAAVRSGEVAKFVHQLRDLAVEISLRHGWIGFALVLEESPYIPSVFLEQSLRAELAGALGDPLLQARLYGSATSARSLPVLRLGRVALEPGLSGARRLGRMVARAVSASSSISARRRERSG